MKISKGKVKMDNSRSKYIFNYAIVILLIAVFFLVWGIKAYRNDIQAREAECYNALEAADMLLNYRKQYADLLEIGSITEADVVARGVAVVIEKSEKGYQQLIDEFNKNASDDKSMELILKNGKKVVSYNKEFPDFNEKQLEYLSLGNHLMIDGEYYAGCSTDNFTLIVHWSLKSDDEELFGNIVKLCPSDIFMFDSETGELFSANSDVVNSSVDELNYVVDAASEGRYRKGHFIIKDSKSSLLARYYRFIEYDVEKDVTACAHFPMALIIDDLFFGVIIPFVLSLIFALITINRCIKFADDWNNKKLAGQKSKLLGIIEISGSLSTRIISMIGVSAFIALIFSSYSIFLPYITNVYFQADTALETVSNLVTYSEEKKEKIKSNYEEDMLMNLSYLDFILTSGDGVVDANLFEDFEKKLHAGEITVFDGNGNIEYSSNYQTQGYKLSSNPNSKEYELWDLINGEPGTKAVYCDDNLEKIYFATSRSDKAGIIRVTIVDGEIAKFVKLLDEKSAIQSMKYPEKTGLFFGSVNNPTRLTYYNSDTNEFNSFETNFPEGAYQNGNSRLVSLRGETYHLTTKTNNGRLFIFANGNYNIIIKESIAAIAELAILYIIISLFIFRVSGVKANQEHGVLNLDSPEINDMLVSLDNTIADVFKFSLIAVVVLTLLDFFMLRDIFGLKYWLISNDKKGFTIYSVGYAFVVIVITAVGTKLIDSVSKAICKCIQKKKITVCQLLSSLLKALVILLAVVVCLRQFNVSPAQMMAFLGISGVAIGLGAKDVINDLVSGAFLILDRHVHIGDYIDVGNFFGRVIEIDIRTTKIQWLNKIVSINNSSMKNVVNNSIGFVSINFDLVISYENDIDEFTELISKNADRYLEADVNHILEKAPKCRGISAYEVNGVRVVIGTSVKVHNKYNAEFLIKNVTKKILDENNIKITGK